MAKKSTPKKVAKREQSTKASETLTVEQAYEIAVKQFKNNELQQAELLCREILKVAPNYSSALDMLGVITAKAGKLDEAERLIKKAIEIAPHEQSYHRNLVVVNRLRKKTQYDLACTYVLRNDFENARICIDELIANHPDFGAAYELAEDIYIRLGLFEAANKIFLARPVTTQVAKPPELPPNYPQELIIPPIIGNGNDYSFIEEKVKQFIASGQPYQLLFRFITANNY